MSFEIKTIPRFDKDIKRLAKKYPSLKFDFEELLTNILLEPTLGTALGNDCYKIRLKISSKGKGKSGGARIITYIQVENETIYLLSIYDKSEKEYITDFEISELLKFI